MPEQLIHQEFVNDFFLELLRAKKHPGRIRINESHTVKINSSADSLDKESRNIQSLEERHAAVPMPMPAVPTPPITLRDIMAPKYSNQISISNPNLLDFGRLNSIINDPNVQMIRCDGSNSPVMIKRKDKVEKTKLILSDREINMIINKFSIRGKKPVTQPIFKAEFSSFAITAVISPISIRFLIERK